MAWLGFTVKDAEESKWLEREQRGESSSRWKTNRESWVEERKRQTERKRERANGRREERNAAKRSRDEILIHGSGAALNRKCSRLATARQAVASGSLANHVTSKRDVWNKLDILESWMIFWRQIRLLLWCFIIFLGLKLIIDIQCQWQCSIIICSFKQSIKFYYEWSTYNGTAFIEMKV